jgi:DNA-binding response OmpR family regulator
MVKVEIKKAKILIVDDSRNIRKLVSVVLKSEEHTIIEAGNGVEALEKARLEGPDLIILDIIIPEKDGIRVCREIRAEPKTKSIPIIVLTSDSASETRKNAVSAGADIFILKPFDPPSLRAAVRKVLKRG